VRRRSPAVLNRQISASRPIYLFVSRLKYQAAKLERSTGLLFISSVVAFSRRAVRGPNRAVDLLCVCAPVTTAVERNDLPLVTYTVRDIDNIESVQRRFTKRLPGFGALTYMLNV